MGTAVEADELVLAELGIPLVVKADESWIHDPSCYVIVATHPTEGMVGGIRLQLDHNPTRPLPMAVSLSELAPDIHTLLDQLRPFGNGEVCGLWSASRYAKRGVTVLLSLAVTAIAPMVGADRLVCFVGHHTKRHPEKNGFVPPRAQAAHQQASHLYKQLQRRIAGKPVEDYRYRDFGSLVSLGEFSTVGNMMGGLAKGDLFIEGWFARVMYTSLYKMHELALHGWVKVTLETLARMITRRTEPHVKLH